MENISYLVYFEKDVKD